MNKVYRISKALKGCVYIGRAFGGYPQSPFHNPFHIGRDGDRQEVLRKFAVYWYAPEQRQLRQRAFRELINQDLMCWCSPLSCHGDVIMGYIAWKTLEEIHTDPYHQWTNLGKYAK